MENTPKKDVTDKDEKENLEEVLSRITSSYEVGPVVGESIVRIEQENKIHATLEAGTPVLIRGVPRVGKTSMLWALEKRKKDQILHESIYGDSTTSTETLEDFKKRLGLYDIAYFIADREERREGEVENEIKQQGTPPYEYLNEYLKEKGGVALLAFDEVIALRNHPEKLAYLAQLKNLSNLRLAIVLHYFGPMEKQFATMFAGFETFFIEALTFEETARLVRTPLQGTNVTISEEALQTIYEFSGGRPLEIQSLCRFLFAPYHTNESGVPSKHAYEKEDVVKIIAGDMDQPRWAETSTRTYRNVYEKVLTDDERSVIKLLLQKGPQPIHKFDPLVVETLTNILFVTHEKQKDLISLNGTLLQKTLEELLLQEQLQ